MEAANIYKIGYEFVTRKGNSSMICNEEGEEVEYMIKAIVPFNSDRSVVLSAVLVSTLTQGVACKIGTVAQQDAWGAW